MGRKHTDMTSSFWFCSKPLPTWSGPSKMFVREKDSVVWRCGQNNALGFQTVFPLSLGSSFSDFRRKVQNLWAALWRAASG